MSNSYGSDTSLDAFMDKVEDLSSDQKKVLDTVANFGPITLNEVAEILDKFPNQISGRFTELRNSNRIKIVGRKQGQRLYEVVD